MGGVREGEGDYLASGQRGEICSHEDAEVVNQFRVRVTGVRADLPRVRIPSVRENKHVGTNKKTQVTRICGSQISESHICIHSYL